VKSAAEQLTLLEQDRDLSRRELKKSSTAVSRARQALAAT
jgi:hypothetical protein